MPGLISPQSAPRPALSRSLRFGQFAPPSSIPAPKGSWSRKHARQWADTVAADRGPITKVPVDQIETEAVLEGAHAALGKSAGDGFKAAGPDRSGIPDAARTRGHIDANRANPCTVERSSRYSATEAEQAFARPSHRAPSCGPPRLHRAAPYPPGRRRRPGARILYPTRPGPAKVRRTVRSDRSGGEGLDPTARSHQDPDDTSRPVERPHDRDHHRTECPGRRFVFPGQSPGTHLTDATLLMVMRRLEVRPRSTASLAPFVTGPERDQLPRRTRRTALGHAVGSAIELAYAGRMRWSAAGRLWTLGLDLWLAPRVTSCVANVGRRSKRRKTKNRLRQSFCILHSSSKAIAVN